MFNRAKQKSSSPKSPHDRLARYWLWHGLWYSHQTLKACNSYFSLLKKEDITTTKTNNRRLRHLKLQILSHYFRNFFLFPLFLFKFLTPSYLKGNITLLSNLKTILTNKEFHPLRIAVVSQFVFILFFIQFSIGVVHYYSSKLHAATYTLTQTNWGGGASTSLFASHSSDQTGWNMFYSTSSAQVNTSVAGEVSLSPSLNSTTQTSNTDFNTWATSSVFVSSTGSSGRIVLLKPLGAVCNQASECGSGRCTNNLCALPPCAYATSLVYSGVTYPLKELGTQCWFASNLNVGTMLGSSEINPSNNSLIEKWCYNNSTANCTTYGGLYTWAEANQLATTCNTGSCTPSSPSQGICPSGWHIPTHTEIKTLESYLGMCAGAGAGCVDATGARGTTQGTQLKSGGSSGFNMLLGGRVGSGSYVNVSTNGWLFSATEGSAAGAAGRGFSSSLTTVEATLVYGKAQGFSVRCLKN